MSLEPMASNNSSLPHHPTTFLSLPGEIRNAIYELALTASKQRTLRPRHELEYREDWFGGIKKAFVTIIDTSLLGVNRQVSWEASEVFYGYHNFHYSIKRRGVKEPPARLVKHLAVIRHLSVSYTASYPRSIRAQRIDNVIAQHIDYITNNCTQLCTLNFHILANQREEEEFRSILKAGHTSRKLRLLSPRLQRLSIVTFGPSDALVEFREGISNHPIYAGVVFKRCPPCCEEKSHRHKFIPEQLILTSDPQSSQHPTAAHWTSQIMESWPQLSISIWEDCGINKRQHPVRSGVWNWPPFARPYERIRVWHLRIPGHRNLERP